MTQSHEKKSVSPSEETIRFLNDLKSLADQNNKAAAAIEKDFRDAYSLNRYNLLND